MSPRRTRGSLSDADRALWEHVIREIRPLRGRKPRPKKDVKSGSEPAAPGAEVELAGKPPVAKLAKAPGKTATPRPPAGPPPLAPIERRTRLRLVRGVVEIDARIDLHGLTRHEAHGRLTRFLIQAQGHGARIVLVITGKGAPAGWGPERCCAARCRCGWRRPSCGRWWWGSRPRTFSMAARARCTSGCGGGGSEPDAACASSS